MQDQLGASVYPPAGLQLSLSTLSPGTLGRIWPAAGWQTGPGHPKDDWRWREISKHWAEENRNKTRLEDSSGKRHSELIFLEQLPKARVIPEELGPAQGQMLPISQPCLVRPTQKAIPGKVQEGKRRCQIERRRALLRPPVAQDSSVVTHSTPSRAETRWLTQDYTQKLSKSNNTSGANLSPQSQRHPRRRRRTRYLQVVRIH